MSVISQLLVATLQHWDAHAQSFCVVLPVSYQPSFVVTLGFTVNLRGLMEEAFYGLDAIAVSQPTVSKH